MAILESTSPVAQEVRNITSRDYALAAFIMGSLIQAGVVELRMLDSDGISDLQVGIRIIAACLVETHTEDDKYNLPFRW